MQFVSASNGLYLQSTKLHSEATCGALHNLKEKWTEPNCASLNYQCWG